MFAWFLRVLFGGIAVALLWAWIPHAVDNYRAMNEGIRGTLTPACAVGDCQIRFDSEDGRLHLDNVDVVSIGSRFMAVPAENSAWIADADSTTAHTNGDWLAGSVAVGFLVLMLAMVLMLLTPDKTGAVVAGPRVIELAGRHNLGAPTGSARWTGHRYLIPALILMELALGVPLVVISGQYGRSPDSFGGLLCMGVFVLAALIFGGRLLAKAWRGAGQSIHLFDDGLVISRGPAMHAYAYSDIVKAKVDRYAPNRGDRPVPYAVTLHDRNGRKVKITLAHAVWAILPHVPVG